MNKTRIALSLALALGASSASAASLEAGAQFLMLSGGGGTVGNFTDLTGSVGSGAWAVASTSPFFGNIWTAHGGTTFGPGTYTFDTTGNGTGTAATTYTGVVVGAGQVGGHIFFDYNGTFDIDVVQVWDITNGGLTYTSTPVTDSNGTNAVGGLAMLSDSSFPGFNANFNFTAAAVPVPAAVWLFGSGLLGLVGVARRKKSA